MTRLLGSVAVLLLALLPLPVAAAPCQPQLIDSVPLTFVNRHYQVQVLINGHPVNLVVDTGAQSTILTSAMVDHLGLPLDDSRWFTINGVAGRGNPNHPARADTLSVGKLSVGAIDVQIDSNSMQGFDGILGADVLLKGDVQIDFPDRLISFYAPTTCRSPAVGWDTSYFPVPVRLSDRSGRIILPVMLNGHLIKAVLDTGASQSVVTDAAAAAAGTSASIVAGVWHSDANGVRSAAYRTPPVSLQIGDERFADVPVNVEKANLGEVDMLLGLDYLRSRTLWISPGRGKVFVMQPRQAAPLLRTSMVMP
jgi:predicted aspartyl protease